MKLKTEFKKVATAGKTIDGREISEKDLVDMAATYDPDEYTATIFFEHIRYYGSYGTVNALKAERDKKKRMCLFASLSPNKRLIELNVDEQAMFTSIEIVPDFAGTGKAYLGGLAVTDDPASLGTEQLRFSNKRGHKSGSYFAPAEPFSISDMVPMDDDTDDEQSERFFERALKKLTSRFNKTDDEDSEMNKQQFATLLAAVTAMGARLEVVEEKFSLDAGGDKPGKDKTPPAKSDDDTDFGKVMESINGFNKRFEVLEAKFSVDAGDGKPGKDKTQPAKTDEDSEFGKVMDAINGFNKRFDDLEAKVKDAADGANFSKTRKENLGDHSDANQEVC